MANAPEPPQAAALRRSSADGVEETSGDRAYPQEHEAEELSALADGQLDPNGVARACANWHSRRSIHATWHTYHLIGDVLRAPDLAGLPRNDYVSLQKLRERLAAEPMVRAPGATLGRVADRFMLKPWPWAAASAVAAGFAAVAGVLFVLRGAADDPQVRARSMVRSDAAKAATLAEFHGAAPPTVGHAPAALPADGKLVRDARLDRYLDAHKHFSGVSALGVPSNFLRGATSDASSR
ncbi:MAG: sigma-E factor negative regulatory protein [Burkholderiaceae bacterium]